MAQLINLPAYQVPNALSFQSVDSGIESVKQNALAQRQMGMQEKQLGMQEKRFGMDEQKFKREQEVAEARRAAGRIQYIKGLPAEQQAPAWQQTLQEPGFRDLPAELRDFSRAAPMIESKAAEYMGEKDRVEIDVKRAQAEKFRREAANGGELPMNVKEWNHFSRMPPEQQQKYLTMKRAERYLDTGTAFQRTNPLQPDTPIASIPKDVAGVAGQKVVGKETAELQFTLPKARAALESANAKVSIVRSKIDQALPMVSNWSVGPGSYLASIPATQARNLREVTNTIIANMGFDELQEMRTNSPTGGALGQVAVQELEMLQKTKTSLDQAQTVDQYKAALNELKAFYDGAVQRRQRAFGETYAPLQGQRTGNSPNVTGPSVPRQFGDRLPQGGPPQPGAQGMIPPAAVQFLRGNPAPEVIQQFEAKYGPGSARQFMGGQ
jgi:hypothetical protein